MPEPAGLRHRLLGRVTGRALGLRTKVLIALGLTLTVATGASLVVDRQITSSRVAEQGEALLRGSLAVVVQADADARAARLTALRFNAQRLQTLGSAVTDDRMALQQTTGDVRRSLGVDGVAITDGNGVVLAASGDAPVAHPLPTQGGGAPVLQGTPGGIALEIIAVRVEQDRWLAAVERVDDARAFELRRLIGREVALLHEGRVVGTTIAEADAVAEAVASAGAADPSRTPVVEVEGLGLVGVAPTVEDGQVAVISQPLLVGLDRNLASAGVVVFLVLLSIALVGGYAFVQRLIRPVAELADTAEAVGRGDPDRTFPTDADDEIGQLAKALEDMRGRLQQQVGIIAQQSAQLRQASQRLAHARDSERRRLARDLHDGAQQKLVMLRLRVGLLPAAAGEQEKAALAAEIDAVIAQLRETSQALYPSILADRGLTGALYSLAGVSAVGLHLDLRPDPLPRLAEPIEAGLYFMVAEALTNALKHARAHRLDVWVHIDPRCAEVLVSDDGVGFDIDRARDGAGLDNIRDRAAALGGLAVVDSRPDEGTAVAVVLPLTGDDPASVGRALQVEQHGGDAPVEVGGLTQPELLEDRARVLLDRAFAHHQGAGDR